MIEKCNRNDDIPYIISGHDAYLVYPKNEKNVKDRQYYGCLEDIQDQMGEGIKDIVTDGVEPTLGRSRDMISLFMARLQII